MKILGLAFFLVAVPSYVFAQDRAHDLASQAANQHPARCPRPNNLTLQDCHDKFADGCSQAANPKYDAYLDFLKDQDPDPGLASTGVLAAADFKNLESQLSRLGQAHTARAGGGRGSRGGTGRSLTSSNHATFAHQLAGLGEGNIHTVIAYLYFAEDTGSGNSPNSETCNCKLLAPNTFDYHIGVGFDSSLANQAGTDHPQAGSPLLSQLQKASVVAEMTPYVRSHHPNWTIDKVQALQGKQVKVVGQLMVDNDHFVAKDDCGFHNPGVGCWRSTVWEIHPVTKMLVCNLSSPCDASSPDSAWTDLDNP